MLPKTPWRSRYHDTLSVLLDRGESWRGGNVICPSRRYSVLHQPRHETVFVPSGSSGKIELRIFNGAFRAPSQPVIIHVPSIDPLPINRDAPSAIPRHLFSEGHTLVTCKPRWNSTHQFPVPSHDLLAAYDWILRQFSTKSETHLPPPIWLHATSPLASSITTSLALTECRHDSPSKRLSPYVSAISVQDGMYDWSTVATSQRPEGNEAAIDSALEAIYNLRPHLFATPNGAFDAFASPMLFFRTTGLHVPSRFPGTEAAVAAEGERIPANMNGYGNDIEDDHSLKHRGRGRMEEVTLYPPTRKSHLVFPPKNSGLRIPFTRIATTSTVPPETKSGKNWPNAAGARGKSGATMPAPQTLQCMLAGQGEELVRLMRRSVRLHEMGHTAGCEARAAEDRIRWVAGQPDDEGLAALSFFKETLR